MLDNDHKPVKLTGLLRLAAILLVFLLSCGSSARLSSGPRTRPARCLGNHPVALALLSADITTGEGRRINPCRDGKAGG